jgi:uncharacterized protein with ParB-like and HNH nuclease domain
LDAHKTLISQIFNITFNVPSYQRLYSWSVDHWEALWESFIDNYENNNKIYFLGSLIIKSQPHQPNTYLLIDGQQRLTSISLLLKAIADVITDISDNKDEIWYAQRILEILKKKEGPKHITYIIEHNDVDSTNFKFILDNDYNTIKKSKKNDTSSLTEAYLFFYNKMKPEIKNKKDEHSENIEEPLTTNQLIQLYQFIFNNCEIIRITLDEKDEEQEIFNAMNSTGLKLSTGDLLKNYFFSKDTLKEKYLLKWQDIFEDNDYKINFWNKELGNRSISQLDLVLYTVLLAKETSVKEFSTFKQNTTYKDLFKSYKKTCDNKEVIQEKLLQNIIDYANKYYELKHKDYNKIDINNYLNLILFCIERTEYNVFFIPILYLETNNINNKNLIYKKIYSLIVIWGIYFLASNKLSKFISDLLNKIQINDITDIITYIDNFLNNNFNNQDKNNLYFPSNNRSNQGRILMTLSLIEAYLRKEKPEEYFIYNDATFSIEHIIPKKHETHYSIKNEELITSIGNLTILTGSHNSKLSNRAWDIKKDLYVNSTLHIVNKLSNIKEADLENEINKRSHDFLKIIVENIF